MLGRVFGRLTVQSLDGRVRGQAAWRCVCECGNETVVGGYSLRVGDSTSCGCYAHERQVESSTRHEMHGTAEYAAWAHMIQRATNPNYAMAEHYVNRGITVANEWRGPGGFAVFFAHIGRRPSADHSVDRINNDGNYEPGNVRWATRGEQMRNQRRTLYIEARGRRQCLTDWAAESGLLSGTIHGRLRNGWDPERAIFEPVRTR